MPTLQPRPLLQMQLGPKPPRLISQPWPCILSALLEAALAGRLGRPPGPVAWWGARRALWCRPRRPMRRCLLRGRPVLCLLRSCHATPPRCARSLGASAWVNWQHQLGSDDGYHCAVFPSGEALVLSLVVVRSASPCLALLAPLAPRPWTSSPSSPTSSSWWRWLPAPTSRSWPVRCAEENEDLIRCMAAWHARKRCLHCAIAPKA